MFVMWSSVHAKYCNSCAYEVYALGELSRPVTEETRNFMLKGFRLAVLQCTSYPSDDFRNMKSVNQSVDVSYAAYGETLHRIGMLCVN